MGKQVHVPVEIQNVIRQQIVDGIAVLEKKYGKHIPFPKITYDKTGGSAGVAHTKDWSIQFNSVLLMENQEDFILRTPRHELAHLACKVIYPETLAPREKVITRTGRLRREKREVHGPRFYEVCRVMGLDDESRTHSYDVTNAQKNIDRTMHVYVCLACNAEIKLTAKRHRMQQNGTRKYHHTCEHKGRIVPKAQMKLSMIGNQPIIRIEAPKPVNEGKMGPTGDSKLAKCWALYKRYHEKYKRQQLIAIFYNEADCTPAGASTYYAQCQKLYREGFI